MLNTYYTIDMALSFYAAREFYLIVCVVLKIPNNLKEKAFPLPFMSRLSQN